MGLLRLSPVTLVMSNLISPLAVMQVVLLSLYAMDIGKCLNIHTEDTLRLQ